MYPIWAYGSRVKERFLPAMALGEKMAASLTELGRNDPGP